MDDQGRSCARPCAHRQVPSRSLHSPIVQGKVQFESESDEEERRQPAPREQPAPQAKPERRVARYGQPAAKLAAAVPTQPVAARKREETTKAAATTSRSGRVLGVPARLRDQD
jgi:hypothetical protein